MYFSVNNHYKELIMDLLKKLFPLSFKYTKDVANLIIGILIYIVIGAIGGVVLGLIGALAGILPIIGGLLGVVLGFIGSIIDLYAVAGIVIQILVFVKVLK